MQNFDSSEMQYLSHLIWRQPASVFFRRKRSQLLGPKQTLVRERVLTNCGLLSVTAGVRLLRPLPNDAAHLGRVLRDRGDAIHSSWKHAAQDASLQEAIGGTRGPGFRSRRRNRVRRPHQWQER